MTAIRHSAFAALLALVAAVPGYAQAACSNAQYNVSNPGNGDAVERMHPLVSRPRYAAFVDAGQWLDAMGAVGADAALAFATANVSSGDSAKFMSQVDDVIRALQRLPNDNTRPAYVGTAVQPIRFDPNMDLNNAYSLFRGGDKIAIAQMTPRQAEAVCWAAMSADRILFRFNLSLEPAAIRLLNAITTSWLNYRSYGYTRQPIELFLQRGSLQDTVPPRGQLILAHLSAGGEISGLGGRLDSLSASQTMVVEVLGGIRYWSNYTRYVGASAIIALSSGHPIGAGALIHLGPGLRGGPVFRKENGTLSTSALMSLDLYGLFDRSKKSVEDGYNAARSLVLLPGK